MTLEKLADIVERKIPTSRCEVVQASMQIIVTFTNRPGVSIALLTPAYQNAMRDNKLDLYDLNILLESLRKVANPSYR